MGSLERTAAAVCFNFGRASRVRGLGRSTASRYAESEMLRFLRNLTAYVMFEMAEVIASILGIVAIVCFVVVAYLSFGFLADKVPTAVNLLLSFLIGLTVSLVPGYAAVRLGKIND